MIPKICQTLAFPVCVKEQKCPDGTVPVVSICCITYNHEDFIRECLEGFIAQETTFPIEILIHDDASTDNTVHIVREYEARYPDIVKPIYQSENQYSKGIKINLTYNFPRVRGKYIAVCEGDDYWISKDKLELQVKALEKNADCDICFHPALMKNYNINGDEHVICRHSDAEKIISVEDVIVGGGEFCPTASLLFRKKVIDDIPEWCHEAPVGDYYLQVIASMRGGALYLDRVLSVYRIGSDGAWSNRNNDKYKLIEFNAMTIRALNMANIWSSKRYEPEFEYRIKICVDRLDKIIQRNNASSRTSGNKNNKILAFLSSIKKSILKQ